ncbi:MAG: hypothetical protein ACJ8AT_28130 [Hyalangium sp.]|uniref:hypothetical protein n=1 Tax=Hyalangium sp. TaxID=2028555 RepID=UPI00389A0E64
MMNSRSMNLWALCGLGLALLVLFPGSAVAQRRGGFREEYADPICYQSQDGVCQKFRIALVGSGILTPDGASSGVGVKAGYSLVLGPRFEVGGDLLFVEDLRFQDGPQLGTAEAVVRLPTLTGPYHRFLLEFGAGASRYESPTRAYWAFPCASGGATLELSGPGLGVFFTGGLSLMWAEGVAALPHAGVGLVF